MKILKKVYIFLSIVFLIYLALPAPYFPEPITGSLQSYEPADQEDILRRGYYSNANRQEALDHYTQQFKYTFVGITLPNYRLNYPPEESQTIIRDQTRSTFLEEIVHPFRESLFVNGFQAQSDNQRMIVEDEIWNLKIIVKYIPSNTVVRLVLGILTVSVGWMLLKEYSYTFSDLKVTFQKLKSISIK